MKWLEELQIGTKSETVKNLYTKEECLLTAEAVAVHDFIKGCELVATMGINPIENSNLMFEALQYFQEKWPAEYLILLD